MILVNYHLPIVWISSNQKYLLLQNHFQLDKFYPFLKAILHECQRTCKFEYLHSSFVSVFQMKKYWRRIEEIEEIEEITSGDEVNSVCVYVYICMCICV